jgi:hypothetical protein
LKGLRKCSLDQSLLNFPGEPGISKLSARSNGVFPPFGNQTAWSVPFLNLF